MTKETDLAAFEAAVKAMPETGFTKDGAPEMKALNEALEAAGHEAISADERNGFMSEMAPPESEPELESIPPGCQRVLIKNAAANPIPLYVHGVGRFSLRIGETPTLPEEAVSALLDAGVDLDILED